MKRLFFFILFLLITINCLAVTYNIGPGQAHETFASFHAAITPSPGDTIFCDGNTFVEAVTISVNGTEKNPIVYQNFILDGNGTIDRGFRIGTSEESIDWITLKDFEIMNVTEAGIYCNTPDCSPTHSRHITIDNGKIHNITGGTLGGIFGWGANVTITNTEIYDTYCDGVWWSGEQLTVTDCNIYNASCGVGINGDCLQLTDNCASFYVANNTLDHSSNTSKQAALIGGVNGTFEYNKCTHLAGDESKCVYVDAKDSLIQYNDISGGTYGIWVVTNTGNTILGNLVYGEITGRGITSSVNTTIINNTVAGNGLYGIRVGNTPSGVVYNNIITGGWNRGFTDWGGNSIEDYNCVYGCTVGNFQGQNKGTHSIEADPLFINPQNFNFHLKSASPCINRGLNVGSIKDFDGNIRDAAIDIGAYEAIMGLSKITLKQLVYERPDLVADIKAGKDQGHSYIVVVKDNQHRMKVWAEITVDIDGTETKRRTNTYTYYKDGGVNVINQKKYIDSNLVNDVNVKHYLDGRQPVVEILM